MADGALGSGAGAATTAAVREQTSRMASRYMRASLSRSSPSEPTPHAASASRGRLPSPSPPTAPAAPPHLQLDGGPELAPRRVPDHQQHGLDDDGHQHVQAF